MCWAQATHTIAFWDACFWNHCERFSDFLGLLTPPPHPFVSSLPLSSSVLPLLLSPSMYCRWPLHTFLICIASALPVCTVADPHPFAPSWFVCPLPSMFVLSPIHPSRYIFDLYSLCLPSCIVAGSPLLYLFDLYGHCLSSLYYRRPLLLYFFILYIVSFYFWYIYPQVRVSRNMVNWIIKEIGA